MTTMIATATPRMRCQRSSNFAASTSGSVIESVSSLSRFSLREINPQDAAIPIISPTMTQ